MFREKLLMTLVWVALVIAGAMLADYVITIVIANDRDAYTPLITLAIAGIVAIPTTYALVSHRIDLRRARDELMAARDVAIAADKAKTQFFSNMSHELRTPLNAIIGFAELLAHDVFAPKRVEYAKLIHSSGEHLLSLVNDLLDLARIEAGRFELKCEFVNIPTLVAECCETVAPQARARHLHIESVVAPALPFVHADPRALKQILLNLLTNAVKFSVPGGTIDVSATRESSGDIALMVRDTGIGIAPEDQAKVFERFGQVRHDVAGIEQGSGLGLPIVKGLAEAHGGRVSMTSALGSGTTVTIWLPADRCVANDGVALAS
jgi:signal transduction histidine kinase